MIFIYFHHIITIIFLEIYYTKQEHMVLLFALKFEILFILLIIFTIK